MCVQCTPVKCIETDTLILVLCGTVLYMAVHSLKSHVFKWVKFVGKMELGHVGLDLR